MASSCPTRRLLRSPNSFSASEPVCDGSSLLLSRTILLLHFSDPCPQRLTDWQHASTVPFAGPGLFPWSQRSHFDPAYQRSLRHLQQIHNDLSDIFGRYHPIGRLGARTKFRVHAAGHDVTHADVIVPVIQHQRLAKSIQAELRCVVSRTARKRILACQDTDIDDVAPLGVIKSL